MYEVNVHYHGRPVVRRGPMEGVLDWPRHKWVKITTRPIGFSRAKALADAQPEHAVVTPWLTAGVVYSNDKAAGIPEGWYPPDSKMN